MARFNLDEHLRREHKKSAFSEYLREIVYGGNDGIITTFAVVAGFAGAQANPVSSAVPVVSVLLFGLANLFADGLSMSVGSFLSLRADQDVYRNEKAKEAHEITQEPENEFEETVEILRRKGYGEADGRAMAALLRKNTAYWTDFMMKDELDMANPEHEKPVQIAIATFLSFTLFGSIPLLPYALGVSPGWVFPVSLAATGLALFLLGVLRSAVTRQPAARGVAETLLLGGISAGVAFYVGTFFRS